MRSGQWEQVHCKATTRSKYFKFHNPPTPLRHLLKQIVYVYFFDFSGPYGPIWARMGPARALEEREKFRKNYFLRNTCLSKIVVVDIHVTFLNGFNLFFRFLAEIRFRTIMKLPQKASSRTKTCSFRTSVTLP